MLETHSAKRQVQTINHAQNVKVSQTKPVNFDAPIDAFSKMLTRFEAVSLSPEKPQHPQKPSLSAEQQLHHITPFHQATGVIEENKPKAAPIPGDINGDGVVDGTDLEILLSLWGTDSPKADFNQDGIVDLSDLSTLLANWTVPKDQEKPEPIIGDINGDGIVGTEDLEMLLKLWGSNAPEADLNGDGIVDISDLNILLANWTIPEEETKPEPIPGDINGDGVVDKTDLETLLKLWGSNAPEADLSGDGIVNFQDLSILLANFTTESPEKSQYSEKSEKPLTGDMNGDGVVDKKDLKLLIRLIEERSKKADINGDGQVNIFDIFELLKNLQVTTDPLAVTE